jgi:hypothetical protein
MAAAQIEEPAVRTFPHRYHRLVAAIFGIHIRIVASPSPAKASDGSQSYQLGRYRDFFSAAAPLSFVAKAEVARWAVLRQPRPAAAHRVR